MFSPLPRRLLEEHYILEPGITIQADVPLRNILAAIDAMHSYDGCSL